jgi:hypothetical protein
MAALRDTFVAKNPRDRCGVRRNRPLPDASSEVPTADKAFEDEDENENEDEPVFTRLDNSLTFRVFLTSSSEG